MVDQENGEAKSAKTIRLRPVKAFLRHGDRLGVKEETESAPKCRKYGGKTRASFVGKIV